MAEQNSKPSMRCPSCGETVFLPAEACPKCSYNFRLGKKPSPAPGAAGGSAAGGSSDSFEEEKRSKVYYIIGAVAALLFIFILFLAFSKDKDEPVAPEATQTPPGTVLQAAPKLSESPLMHPERPIGAAKNVAGAMDDRTDEMEDIYGGGETSQQ